MLRRLRSTELSASQCIGSLQLAVGKSYRKPGGISCFKPTHNAGPFANSLLLEYFLPLQYYMYLYL
jgi:hypothetical protein